MSDTPRTDALDHRTCAFGLSYRLTVHADLCRELERELTEARELSSTLADFGDDLRAQVGELTEELELARENASMHGWSGCGTRWVRSC